MFFFLNNNIKKKQTKRIIIRFTSKSVPCLFDNIRIHKSLQFQDCSFVIVEKYVCLVLLYGITEIKKKKFLGHSKVGDLFAFCYLLFKQRIQFCGWFAIKNSVNMLINVNSKCHINFPFYLMKNSYIVKKNVLADLT